MWKRHFDKQMLKVVTLFPRKSRAWDISKSFIQSQSWLKNISVLCSYKHLEPALVFLPLQSSFLFAGLHSSMVLTTSSSMSLAWVELSDRRSRLTARQRTYLSTCRWVTLRRKNKADVSFKKETLPEAEAEALLLEHMASTTATSPGWIWI